MVAPDGQAAVLEVSHALNSILDPEALLKEVAEVIHRTFGYPYVHLFNIHPGQRKINFAAGSGERASAYTSGFSGFDLDAPDGIIPHVARTGQTLLANDVSREPHYVPSSLPPYDTNSELTIPILYNGEVLGILDLQSDEPNAFDQNDRVLLEALAATVAVALRNATLYRSETWRRKVAESFRDVAGLLSANIALDALFERILVALESNLPCEASAIWLLEQPSSGGKPDLHLAAAHGAPPQHIIAARHSDPAARSWLDQAISAPAPSIRVAGDPYGPLGLALGYPPDYSSISCPLRSGDRILGVLSLAHPTRGRYGHEARDIITVFANYAAVAIQNVRLYNEAQEQAWISTVLLQVAESNQSMSGLDDLLENTVRLIPMLLGVHQAGIFLWSEARQAFEVASVYEMPGLQKGSLLFERDHPALLQLRTAKSNLLVDQPATLDLPGLSSGEAILLIPLTARGELQAALLVNAPNLNQQKMSILRGIAHQLAISIENLRLLEARQEEAYVTAVLLQVAQAVVTAGSLDDILDTIVHLMPILVGIDASIIYLWDKQRRRYTPSQAHSGFKPEEHDLLSRVYAEGAFCLLDTVRESDTFVLSPLSSSDLPPAAWPDLECLAPGVLPGAEMTPSGAWLLGLPLSVKGEPFGVLLIKENNDEPGLREHRMEIITGIAQELALAVQNEELHREMLERQSFEREMQLAREIQRTFLPDHLPSPAGWELDARWQTARQVGGDFYDIFSLGKGRLAVVIADVADKGMPAALYMTVTRSLIRASVQHLNSPARVLERVNNLLALEAQNGMFVTALFAELHLQTGQVIFANAGHNRPYLLQAGGTIVQLAKGGMALGVLEDTTLADQSVLLQPGDCMVLFTDGVTDSFSPAGEPFSETRLVPVIAAQAGQSAVRMLDAIEEALVSFRGGGPPSDDITLLAVRRLAA